MSVQSQLEAALAGKAHAEAVLGKLKTISKQAMEEFNVLKQQYKVLEAEKTALAADKDALRVKLNDALAASATSAAAAGQLEVHNQVLKSEMGTLRQRVRLYSFFFYFFMAWVRLLICHVLPFCDVTHGAFGPPHRQTRSRASRSLCHSCVPRWRA